MKKQILGLDWKEHLLYISIILAVGWFFQQKTAEQARLHGIMEEVFPLATHAIAYRQNEYLLMDIHRNADYYRSDRRETYRARAKAIQIWTESAGAALERVAGLQDVKDQCKELAPVLEQLLHLPDSILLACDSDSAVGQQLRKIFPDEFWNIAAEYVPKAEQPELARLANALRIRTELAANAGLRYCFSRVRDFEIRYAHIPVLEVRQSCPKVGDLFEADIHLASYIADPDFEVEINGRPVVADNGLVHFEQRFSRPGKHKIKARFVRPMSEEGEKRMYEWEFEVEVQPR